MRMIYTVTLNPALDVSVWVEDLTPNEKNYVEREAWYPGGNGVNVARLLQRLRVPVVATGFLGAQTGERYLKLLKAEKVRSQFQWIQEETRLNLTISTEKSHNQTRLSFPGPKIQKSEWARFQKFLLGLPENCFLVFGGSFPRGLSEKNLKPLLKELRRRQIPFCLDIPGDHLGDLIQTKPLFIKPNLTEFQQLTGRKVESIPDVIKLARKYTDFVPLICVSSVEGGALLISADQAWFGRIPKVKIKSTVGAGDSMVAAMVATIHKFKIKGTTPSSEIPGDEILRAGLAASCATLAHSGTQLGSRTDYLKFLKATKVLEVAES